MEYTLLIIFIISFALSIYFFYRNDETYKFRTYINQMCYDYNIRHLSPLSNLKEDAYKWFYDKYSYEDMLFSFNPLKLKYWYTKEEIDKINN